MDLSFRSKNSVDPCKAAAARTSKASQSLASSFELASRNPGLKKIKQCHCFWGWRGKYVYLSKPLPKTRFQIQKNCDKKVPIPYHVFHCLAQNFRIGGGCQVVHSATAAVATATTPGVFPFVAQPGFVRGWVGWGDCGGRRSAEEASTGGSLVHNGAGHGLCSVAHGSAAAAALCVCNLICTNNVRELKQAALFFPFKKL